LAATRHADPELRGVVCDVSQEAQVRAIFAQASDFLGGLDILVNTAGAAGSTALVEGMAFAHWRQCLAVNLDATSLRALAATPLLRAQSSGSNINLSSTAGQCGFPRRAPYAAAKWAIQGFARTLAQKLGRSGVRVNGICPGSVGGGRIDRVIAPEAAKTHRSDNGVRAEYVDGVSLKTFVAPEDIANTILFLPSRVGVRLSGHDITVDGHTETL